VTIHVDPPPPNVPPVAADDTVSTTRNTPVTIDVLANDSDSDGVLVPSTVTIVAGPSKVGSTAVVNPSDGTIFYTPKQNFQGTDVFFYQVSDDDGAVSNVATVRVNVVKP